MILDSVLNIGAKILDRVIPDKAEREKAQAELVKMQLNGELSQLAGQLEINKAEASHQSVFVAGWRPFIGWVCGVALCYQFVLRPVITWAVPSLGYTVAEMPGLDDNLWELMFGMLGLGGLRSYEKIKLSK
jgi:hypothetical protein